MRGKGPLKMGQTPDKFFPGCVVAHRIISAILISYLFSRKNLQLFLPFANSLPFFVVILFYVSAGVGVGVGVGFVVVVFFKKKKKW